jgi:UDP-glucose 4-epimerase
LAHTCLITGGAGFIGSHLAERLVALDRRVVVIDDLSTGRIENIAPLLDAGRIELIHGRVTDVLRGRPQVMRGVSQVYHLAASVGVKLVVDDPGRMVRNNIEETAAVLDAAEGVTAAVLIASSSEVYGQCPVLPLREDMPLVYGPTTASRWSYGMAKALDEHLALHGPGNRPRRCLAVRLFNTIGPRQVGHYGMVVPRMIDKARRDEAIEVYGDGRQTRTFCDVRDVVAAMICLLDDDANLGRVYNLGSDRPWTIDALADLILSLTGGRGGKRYVPYEQVYGPGFEDPPQRLPDLTRIRTAIGFEPTYTLERTLRSILGSDAVEAVPATAARERA